LLLNRCVSFLGGYCGGQTFFDGNALQYALLLLRFIEFLLVLFHFSEIDNALSSSPKVGSNIAFSLVFTVFCGARNCGLPHRPRSPDLVISIVFAEKLLDFLKQAFAQGNRFSYIHRLALSSIDRPLE